MIEEKYNGAYYGIHRSGIKILTMALIEGILIAQGRRLHPTKHSECKIASQSEETYLETIQGIINKES